MNIDNIKCTSFSDNHLLFVQNNHHVIYTKSYKQQLHKSDHITLSVYSIQVYIGRTL